MEQQIDYKELYFKLFLRNKYINQILNETCLKNECYFKYQQIQQTDRTFSIQYYPLAFTVS